MNKRNIRKLRNLSTGCGIVELNCSSAMARHLWATNIRRKEQRKFTLNVKALTRNTCEVTLEHNDDYFDIIGCASITFVIIVMLIAVVTIWTI